MTRIHVGFACAFAIFCYHVSAIEKVACGPNADEKSVVLQSQEGECFRVPVKVAKESETIKNLIEDNLIEGAAIQNPIPLPNINNRTLEAVATAMTLAHDESTPKNRMDVLRAQISKVLDSEQLTEIAAAANYLDIKDLLTASLGPYGQRIFETDLKNVGKMSDKEYAAYKKAALDPLSKDLSKLVISQSLRSIDRIYPKGVKGLKTDREGRRDEAAKVPLHVAQIVAYIAKYQTKTAENLPAVLRAALKKSTPKQDQSVWNLWGYWPNTYADAVLFGPIESPIWPSSCPLPGLQNYKADADDKPDARYIDNKDGTVIDLCTRLIWEQIPAEGAFHWARAKNYCADLVKANSQDWHLPTKTELASLIDKNKGSFAPMWNQVFGTQRNTYFWSSSPGASNTNAPWVVGSDYLNDRGDAWVVGFEHGNVREGNVASELRVRCVR